MRSRNGSCALVEADGGIVTVGQSAGTNQSPVVGAYAVFRNLPTVRRTDEAKHSSATTLLLARLRGN